mgnify:FL=1
MISGEFRKWKNVWEDSTIKVERSHQTADRENNRDDCTEPIVIDITLEDDSESESETEESYHAYYPDELYTWFDDGTTVTLDGNVEITLRRVNNDIIGYNNKGKLIEEKQSPRTIKII